MLGLKAPRTPAGFPQRRTGQWKLWDPNQLAALGWPVPQPTQSVLPYVDDWSAMGIPAAWRCACLISDGIAGLPMYAYVTNPDGSEARLDPTPDLLRDPWPILTYHDWTFGVVWSLLLRGNAYALPADFDTATGYPRQFVLLNPDQVWVDTDSVNGLPAYHLMNTDRGDVVLSPGEIVHWRGVTPPGSPVGIGVIEAHRRGLAGQVGLGSYGEQAFSAGVPSGILTVDRNELGKEQADDIKGRWMASFSGRREPAVVPRSLTFEALSFTPEDMQYIEARRLGATEVCWMMGVHPNMIGAPAGNSMTYQNLEATTTDFARVSLTPWSARIEQTMTKWTSRAWQVRFEYGGLLRGTTMERFQAYDVALRTGLLTLNETRDLEHRPRYDTWADEPFATKPGAEPEPAELVVLPEPESEEVA